MPEPGDQQGAPASAERPTAATAGRDAREGRSGAGEHRLYFGLGVGVQTLLWFLLFLALVVAVAVGSELTEFRYVGF